MSSPHSSASALSSSTASLASGVPSSASAWSASAATSASSSSTARDRSGQAPRSRVGRVQARGPRDESSRVRAARDRSSRDQSSRAPQQRGARDQSSRAPPAAPSRSRWNDAAYDRMTAASLSVAAGSVDAASVTSAIAAQIASRARSREQRADSPPQRAREPTPPPASNVSASTRALRSGSAAGLAAAASRSQAADEERARQERARANHLQLVADRQALRVRRRDERNRRRGAIGPRVLQTPPPPQSSVEADAAEDASSAVAAARRQRYDDAHPGAAANRQARADERARLDASEHDLEDVSTVAAPRTGREIALAARNRARYDADHPGAAARRVERATRAAADAAAPATPAVLQRRAAARRRLLLARWERNIAHPHLARNHALREHFRTMTAAAVAGMTAHPPFPHLEASPARVQRALDAFRRLCSEGVPSERCASCEKPLVAPNLVRVRVGGRSLGIIEPLLFYEHGGAAGARVSMGALRRALKRWAWRPVPLGEAASASRPPDAPTPQDAADFALIAGAVVALCRSCHRALMRDQLPATCLLNNLLAVIVPPELVGLRAMEKRLIARVNVFHNIVVLSRHGQRGTRGLSIAYRQAVSLVVNDFPQPLEHAGTVIVQPPERLPRAAHGVEDDAPSLLAPLAQPYRRIRNHEVHPARITAALDWLRTHNELYSDIRLTSAGRYDESPMGLDAITVTLARREDEGDVDSDGLPRAPEAESDDAAMRRYDASARAADRAHLAALVARDAPPDVDAECGSGGSGDSADTIAQWEHAFTAQQDCEFAYLEAMRLQEESVLALWKSRRRHRGAALAASASPAAAPEPPARVEFNTEEPSSDADVLPDEYDFSSAAFQRGPLCAKAEEGVDGVKLELGGVKAEPAAEDERAPEDAPSSAAPPDADMRAPSRSASPLIEASTMMDATLDTGANEPMDVLRLRARAPPTPVFRLARIGGVPIVAAQQYAYEALAHPTIYPTGQFHWGTRRVVRLSALLYFRSRLQSRLRGRLLEGGDLAWLFMATQAYQWEQVRSAINIALLQRAGGHAAHTLDRGAAPDRGPVTPQSGEPVTAGMVRANAESDPAMRNICFMFMSHVRGTIPYWMSTRRALLSMLNLLGAPTFFVTLSADDLNWPDATAAALGISPAEAAQLSAAARLAAVNANPDRVARAFMQRWHAFFEKVLRGPPEPLGHIVDFFWRVEFQQRGSPHIHALLWVAGAPSSETAAGVAALPAFIDRYITCAIPAERDDAELRALVLSKQQHRCTFTCLAGARKKCRFWYPKAPCAQTRRRTDADRGVRKSEFYLLRRARDERHTNPYNPTVLREWKANMDIQFVGNAYGCCAYVMAYVTKEEPEKLRAVIAGALGRLPPASSVYRQLLRVASSMLGQREMSAQECAFVLLGLRLKGSSRTCVQVNSRPPNRRMRLLARGWRDKAPDATDIFCGNVVERYMARPLEDARDSENVLVEWERMTLHHFATWYEQVGAAAQVQRVSGEDADEPVHDSASPPPPPPDSPVPLLSVVSEGDEGSPPPPPPPPLRALQPPLQMLPPLPPPPLPSPVQSLNGNAPMDLDSGASSQYSRERAEAAAAHLSRAEMLARYPHLACVRPRRVRAVKAEPASPVPADEASFESVAEAASGVAAVDSLASPLPGGEPPAPDGSTSGGESASGAASERGDASSPGSSDDSSGRARAAAALPEQLPPNHFRLTNGAVVRRVRRERCVQVPYLTEERDGDAYFYSLLLLHVPFRAEASVLAQWGSAGAAFLDAQRGGRVSLPLPVVSSTQPLGLARRVGDEVERILALDAIYDDAEDAADAGQAGLDEHAGVREPQLDEDNPSCLDGYAQRPAELDVPHAQARRDAAVLLNELGDDEVEPVPLRHEWRRRVAGFTPSQRAFYDVVRRHVLLDRAHAMDHPAAGALPGACLFLTGGAGVGKSHMIMVVRDMVRMCAPARAGHRACLLMAPTGVAAFNIGGVTIHAALRIRVAFDERDAGKACEPLNAAALRELRDEFADVAWIVIDEISMVPYVMLHNVDLRLRQLALAPADAARPFGNRNVLCVGDFYQLRPVHAGWIFAPHAGLAPLPGHHLWRDLFRMHELVENVRQSRFGAGDSAYAALLNRMRVGQQGPLDWDTLALRLPRTAAGSTRAVDVTDRCWRESLHLYATNAQCDVWNARQTEHVHGKGDAAADSLFSIRAIDAFQAAGSRGPATGLRNQQAVPDHFLPVSVSQTGSLPTWLHIGVGSRVMLRRNVQVGAGLVNGACGVVTGFEWPNDAAGPAKRGDHPLVVWVRFDDPRVGAKTRDALAGNPLARGPRSALPLSAAVTAAVQHERDGAMDAARLSASLPAVPGACEVRPGSMALLPVHVTFPSLHQHAPPIVRQQFPLMLAWATSIHKVQGLTLARASVDLVGLFASGMAYVALSRVQSLEGLSVLALHPSSKGMYNVDPQVAAEYRRLRAQERRMVGMGPRAPPADADAE